MNASTRDTTLAPAPTVGHYPIDPVRTTVRFSTPHLLGLGAISGTVRLRESDFSVTKPYPRRCTPSGRRQLPHRLPAHPRRLEVRRAATRSDTSTPRRWRALRLGLFANQDRLFQIRTPEPRRMP